MRLVYLLNKLSLLNKDIIIIYYYGLILMYKKSKGSAC